MKKQDWLFLTTISIILILGILFLYGTGYFFGSVTDWPTQHTMLPEYLRQQFYETKNLFPDFALSLGAGQNIYNISYYGLYNPIILLSYLFPWIDMIHYMIIVSILSIIISMILCYKWLKNHHYNPTTIRVTTLLFVCAAPIIFQSHRHLMFVNYFPFLFLTLIGIDAYFQKKKIGLYTIGTLGMILTSYYYSIGGILVSIIYGITRYLKNNKKVTIKKFLRDGIHFLIPIFLAIGISAILLFPTLHVILEGRTGNKEPITLLELLTPHLDIDALVYSSYSIGLTAIALFALIHPFFTKKKENIFLSVTIIFVLTIPIVMYVLNGLLYVRAKALIPFLPLCILLIAHYLEDLQKKKVSLRIEAITLLGLIVVFLLSGYQNSWLYLDCFITLLSLCLYHEIKNKYVWIIPICTIAIVTALTTNTSEKWQSIQNYQNAFSADKEQLIQTTIEQDSSFYRFNDLTETLLTVNKTYPGYHQTSLYSSTYHLAYQDLFYNTFGNADTYRNRLVTSQSNNILFQTYMNVKYIIAPLKQEPAYYELQNQKGSIGLYKNPYVYPLGFASNQLYKEEEYNKLKFPYNTEVMMHHIVVKEKGTNQFSTNIQTIDLEKQANTKNLKIEPYKDGYQVTAPENTTLNIKLGQTIEAKQILILKFKVEESANCKEGDLSIKINAISNKLTCKQWMYHNNNYEFEYVLSNNQPYQTLEVTFSKGTFKIIEEEAYLMDYTDIITTRNQLDEWQLNPEKTKGNHLEGSIDVQKDGYFTVTIPYEKYFDILVDGKKQNYEQVNQTFIGFPIKQGKHIIEITYHAPWKRIGMGISVISLVLFLYLTYHSSWKKEKNRKIEKENINMKK